MSPKNKGLPASRTARGNALTQSGQWHYTDTDTEKQDSYMQAHTKVAQNMRMGDPEIPPDIPPEVPQPVMPPGIPPAGPPESIPEPPVEIPPGQPTEIPDTWPDES
jgi:hypothetical protein